MQQNGASNEKQGGRQLPQVDQNTHFPRLPQLWSRLGAFAVIAVWLLASWSATAAELRISAVAQPAVGGLADVDVQYSSSGHDGAAIRLYVDGKRRASAQSATGSWRITGLPAGSHKFVARVGGSSPQWSNEVLLAVGVVPAAPTIPLAATAAERKRRDAARLLLQASFGPRSVPDIDAVAALGSTEWIDRQMALGWDSHVAYLARLRSNGLRVEEQHVFEAIWQNMIFGDARLRARVALALSEIFVVSNIAPDQDSDALVGWMDMLYRNAFSDYRTLLRDATLQPAMGYYLNMLGNDKEDPASGRMPSENYAREVLQLFSIGLAQLNPDGTPKRDMGGKLIPTYDQNVVQGFAKVFTGWSFGGNDTSFSAGFNPPQQNWHLEMQAWPSHHSTDSKLLLNGATLPAGQTPERDLNDALDNIAYHPNVGPFIGKRLIQFLVTSNPSPAYVTRITAVWDNNGVGQRGDLRAVVRAILLDGEAREPSVESTQYGKLREPMVRFVHLLNAMGAKSSAGRNSVWWLDSPDDHLGQSPLLAASVFNFFSPLYTRAGPIAQAGLVAPEFQNATDTQVVGSTNFLSRVLREGGFGFDQANRINLDATPWLADASSTAKLVERINWTLFAGGLTVGTRQILEKAINAIPITQRDDRMQTALNLALVAPEFVIQK